MKKLKNTGSAQLCRRHYWVNVPFIAFGFFWKGRLFKDFAISELAVLTSKCAISDLRKNFTSNTSVCRIKQAWIIDYKRNLISWTHTNYTMWFCIKMFRFDVFALRLSTFAYNLIKAIVLYMCLQSYPSSICIFPIPWGTKLQKFRPPNCFARKKTKPSRRGGRGGGRGSGAVGPLKPVLKTF